MRVAFPIRRAVCVSLLAGAGAAFAASGASAAPVQQTVTCEGQTIVVSGNTDNSKQSWYTAQILSGGTGAGSPVAISGVVLDDSQGGAQVATYSASKGQGNAEQNQQTITCTQTITDTAGDFFGSQLPSGVSASDMVEFDLTITVVPKGQFSITGTG